MSGEGGLLVLSPPELKFKFELNKSVPVQLSLYNPTDTRMAFKIKTTQPRRYSVRPSAGFVDPGATVEVRITMQPQTEFPTDISNSKDKFLVQSVSVGNSETEVTQEMFTKDSAPAAILDQKLKVVFEVPPLPAPIIEIDETKNKTEVGGEPTPSPYDLNSQDAGQLKHRIELLEKERNNLRDKLSLLELKGGTGRDAVGAASSSKLRLIHLLGVAIISFLIGHFL
eukprot:TRINITY_DN5290_c0_g1_i1.p3 TRINITY_DN5290_c0_g1~~TRINITY_DN5290_c0_g1_i1.p3  ORF type:complete len:226 (-),score=19.91 TRINITY_DN5290_c0_g1_i1:1350-2027(-)